MLIITISKILNEGSPSAIATIQGAIHPNTIQQKNEIIHKLVTTKSTVVNIQQVKRF